MFEVGWSELLVIAVVLIVVVGPKDLPRMLRTFGKATTQMRRMAGDFRRQFDEALREAELDDVRDIGRMDPRNRMREALNPIRSVGDEIRSSLRSATKAPEPKIPEPDAPAKPVEPVLTAEAAADAEAAAAARPAPAAAVGDRS
jgi:sec-independent protein translocase protein TatB